MPQIVRPGSHPVLRKNIIADQPALSYKQHTRFNPPSTSLILMWQAAGQPKKMSEIAPVQVQRSREGEKALG
jgi:hypothetical protein